MLRPKIGVVIADTDYGPVLLYVSPGSPAFKAGLTGARQRYRRGLFEGYVIDVAKADFILAINGKQVADKSQILDALGNVEPNQQVRLLVRRGVKRNRTREVKVVPELR